MPGTENNELSERERDILRLVATGASNKEIAQQLSISVNTVKVHLRNVFTKIDAASRTEAAMYAIRIGLAQADSSQVEGANSRSTLKGKLASKLPVPWWGGAGAVVLFILILAAGILFIRQPGMLAASPSVVPVTATPQGWAKSASLPTPRKGLAVAVQENQVFAIGGEDTRGVTGAVERYDPASNKWDVRAPKPVPVTDASAAVIGGKIYIPGGRLSSGEPSNRLDIYDPYADRWSQGAPLPTALSAYAMSAFEGQLYLFGGWDGKKYVNNTYRYDPGSDRWASLSPVPTARGYAGAAAAGGKIYVMGGYDGKKSLTVNEVYLPERDNGKDNPWDQAKALPYGRYAMGITSLADIIWLVGGQQDGNTPVYSLEFLPSTNTWLVLGNSLVLDRSHLGLVSLESKLFALGGQSDNLPVDHNQVYQTIYTVVIPLVR